MRYAAFTPLLLLASTSLADVRMPAIFSDGMVVQRECEIAIWGFARPGEKVTVTPSWKGGGANGATADASGLWDVHVNTPEAGGPYTITIAGETTLAIRDVMVGEVWLASGQSNMEWTISQSDGASEAASNANAAIRFFNVPNTTSLHARLDTNASWQTCTPATTPGVSAVAYHFANELQRELNVPIGIIEADWGGTRIEAWMSDRALRGFDAYSGELRTLGTWRDPTMRPNVGPAAEDAWWASLDTSGRNAISAAWTKREFDDASWSSIEVPGTWSTDGLDRFDGVVYLRRTFEVPDSAAGQPAVLSLGPIDDRDETFINGVRVGATREDGKWNAARGYEVPEGLLKAGPAANVLCVRVLDTAGPGGFGGKPEQLVLKPLTGPAIPLAGSWKYRRGLAVGELPARPQPINVHANTATALYNGMIAPIARYGMRGAIWYQGESNIGGRESYTQLLTSMVTDWRLLWGRGDFPIYFVQIAPYGYFNDRGATAELRDQQLETMRSLTNSGMAATIDIGDPADIHPRNKKEVGRRLALWALAKDFARDVVPSGPLASSSGEADGAMRVTFEHADGLKLANVEAGFMVAGADHVFFPASAKIEGESLVLSSSKVPHAVAARYGWEKSPSATLFNGVGLPAPPFRTDDWKTGDWAVDEEAYLEPMRTKEDGFSDLIPMMRGTGGPESVARLFGDFNPSAVGGWINVNVAHSTFSWTHDELGRPMIHCTGEPTGLLRTKDRYRNYILELEWRHLQSGGNAGVFVHSDALPAKGVPWSKAIEVQVMDGAEGDGFTSDGDIFPIWGATMMPITARGKSSRAFPTERRVNPAPRWNHYRVECKDGEITLAVNGKVVTRGKDANPSEGYICLESEGTPCDFRNIRIKELPSATPADSSPPASDAAAQPGFVALFNGLDFSGWKHTEKHEGHWTIDGGVLKFDGQGTHLWSERSFKNFVLVCDWRFTKKPVPTERPVINARGEVESSPAGTQLTKLVPDAGDSGIYLRGNDKSQVNMWCWPIGSGEVYGYRTDASMPADVRAGVTPKEVADAPLGEWNRFVITMVDDHLKVVLNGKVVIENAHLPGVPAEGPIALQQHGDPVEFTNIFVMELK